MQYLLQVAADRIDAAYQPPPDQTRKARETVQGQCLFGDFRLDRTYYHSPQTGGHYPADAGLGLELGYTPALVRIVCLEGADEQGFMKAENHLKETGGIRMDVRQIQRLVQRVGPLAQAWQERPYQPSQEPQEPIPIMYVSGDGSGIPMRKAELQGRQGKQADAPAKTRQANLGCVFTQHRVDEDGHPVRDWDSTTYVSTMGTTEELGLMLRAEALRRGMARAQQVVVLIDGAQALEKMGQNSFKDATQIVDFYHAMEHAGKVIVAQLGRKDHPDYKRRRSDWTKRLLNDGVQRLIDQTRQEIVGSSSAAAVEQELHYFVSNVHRMRYRTFRHQGYFIGSGVIEAGCKTVIGARCKQSGMFWSTPGARHILALRCIHASRRDDAFWQHRAQLLAQPKKTARAA